MKSILNQNIIIDTLSVEKLNDIGVVGDLFRLHIKYKSKSFNLPTVLIAKFSNNSQIQRKFFHHMSLYDKEVNFYQNLSAHSKIHIPKCYYSYLCNNTGFSFLLLEDLSHYKSKGICEGSNVAEISAVIYTLASLHSTWWGNEFKVSLPLVNTSLENIYKLYHGCWPKFNRKLNQISPNYKLPDKFLELGDFITNNEKKVVKLLSDSPSTLVHMDTHLNNMFFTSSEGVINVAMIDWQTYVYGKGVTDLTYFMITSVDVSLRRTIEQDCLKEYYKHLMNKGVENHSFEQCYLEYKQAAFWNILVLVVGVVFGRKKFKEAIFINTIMPRLVAFIQDHNLIPLNKYF